ncbi:MAG: Biotin transporter BioY2 [Candidatus Anoxychlamydiales bacterium]|nr:Biotin transporter BioY2 [Candidatus Anoxychlamydiales bacterium]
MQLLLTKKNDFTILKDILLTITLSILLGLFAKVYIPLFFTPIPLVLQNSIALSYVFFFKPRVALGSLLLFVFLGTIGLPFFSNGNHGLNYLLSTNGGYILAYFISSVFVLKLKELNKLSTFSLAIIAHIMVLAIGSFWLSRFLGISKAFVLGFLPFIATDIIKSVFIAKLQKEIK